MTEVILLAVAFILYMLGAVVTKEYVDTIEEVQSEYLPRPFPYWTFILTWPYRAAKAVLEKEIDSE